MAFDWRRLTVIPDFVPASEIGGGGQGAAVRGRWRGREVVVKVLFPDAFDATAWEHARAATTITHPNVIHIDHADVVELDGELLHYVVMPYVDGRSLRQAMDAGDPWSVPQALTLAAQVADGLSALHAVGRIHRDIKPDNLLYGADGRIQIIDLDLVHYEGFDTLTGRWAFTPGYAAQEVGRFNRFSERSDLFALGIVLYEIVAGRHPFAAATPDQMQVRIQQQDGPDTLAMSVPPPVRELLARLLAHRAANRPVAADDVAGELRGATDAPRRSLGDVAVGIRVSSDARGPIEAYLANDATDFLVVEGKRLPAGFPTGWESHEGPVLVDPRTDWLAAGLASESFRNLAQREWKPDPFIEALVTGSNDDELVGSVLEWQVRLGATALISPYVRVEHWRSDGSSELERNRELATAALRVARERWADRPFYAGIAISSGTFKDDDRRDEVLEVLTALRADGAYVVIEDKASERADYLEILADFGRTLKGQQLEAILAYAGPEAVAIAGSGSWDGLVTGHLQSYRAAQFQPQGGGNSGTRPERLLAHGFLYEVQDATLRKLARVAPGTLRCDCAGCRSMFSGDFHYDHAHQGPHYYGSLLRWFRELRTKAPTDRASHLIDRFETARQAAPAINSQAPTALRVRTTHLSDWQRHLLQR